MLCFKSLLFEINRYLEFHIATHNWRTSRTDKSQHCLSQFIRDFTSEWTHQTGMLYTANDITGRCWNIYRMHCWTTIWTIRFFRQLDDFIFAGIHYSHIDFAACTHNRYGMIDLEESECIKFDGMIIDWFDLPLLQIYFQTNKLAWPNSIRI